MKHLKSFFTGLSLFIGVWLSKFKETIKAKTLNRKVVSLKEIQEKKRRDRYLMHSMLKAGDTYTLGECTVTLMDFGVVGKEQAAKRIEAANQRRAFKLAQLTKRGEEIMLMNEKELEDFLIEEWILKIKNNNTKKLYDGLNSKLPN